LRGAGCGSVAVALVAEYTLGAGELHREWKTLRSGWRVVTISRVFPWGGVEGRVKGME